jgi:hypothetical protein
MVEMCERDVKADSTVLRVAALEWREQAVHASYFQAVRADF